jgi:hypothetical protein
MSLCINVKSVTVRANRIVGDDKQNNVGLFWCLVGSTKNEQVVSDRYGTIFLVKLDFFAIAFKQCKNLYLRDSAFNLPMGTKVEIVKCAQGLLFALTENQQVGFSFPIDDYEQLIARN